MAEGKEQETPDSQVSAVTVQTHTGERDISTSGQDQIDPQPRAGELLKQASEAVRRTAGTRISQSASSSSKAGTENASLPFGKDVSLAEQEVAKLTLQIEQYYHSSHRWARIWMIMFIFSLCIELFLVIAFILSFLISYQKDLLTDGTLAGNLITWWNVRVLIVTLLVVNLLIILSGNFNKRWRLNQSTLGKLAAFKVDLANSSVSLDDVRTTLKAILDAHNQGLKKQKMFTGPELS